MTGQEIFIVYGFPTMLMVGGALMLWRNRVVMRRARLRDSVAVPLPDAARPSASRGEIEDIPREMHTGPASVGGRMAKVG